MHPARRCAKHAQHALSRPSLCSPASPQRSSAQHHARAHPCRLWTKPRRPRRRTELQEADLPATTPMRHGQHTDARPAAAEQSACAQAVAWSVISHDHSTACAERLGGSTFGATAAHLVGAGRRPRHRWKALDERLASVPTARAVRAIGAVREAKHTDTRGKIPPRVRVECPAHRVGCRRAGAIGARRYGCKTGWARGGRRRWRLAGRLAARRVRGVVWRGCATWCVWGVCLVVRFAQLAVRVLAMVEVVEADHRALLVDDPP
eukprot:5377397-Prymnesium_polylepis.1